MVRPFSAPGSPEHARRVGDGRALGGRLFAPLARHLEDGSRVPDLRTGRLAVGVLQHRHRDQALPRFAAPCQEAAVALVVVEGCCQTGCRQGRVGRVLSILPNNSGKVLGASG